MHCKALSHGALVAGACHVGEADVFFGLPRTNRGQAAASVYTYIRTPRDRDSPEIEIPLG